MQRPLLSEAIEAGRGIIALLLGRHSAVSHFDFSLSGLMGSLIAFMIAVAFDAFAPGLFGLGSGAFGPSLIFTLSILTLLAQAGAAYLMLNLFGRTDGFVPFLVASNWSNFFITILSALLVLISLDANISMIVLLALALAMAINIARLVVTLSAGQIIGFLIAQAIGLFVASQVVAIMFPEAWAMQEQAVQSMLSGMEAVSANS